MLQNWSAFCADSVSILLQIFYRYGSKFLYASHRFSFNPVLTLLSCLWMYSSVLWLLFYTHASKNFCDRDFTGTVLNFYVLHTDSVSILLLILLSCLWMYSSVQSLLFYNHASKFFCATHWFGNLTFELNISNLSRFKCFLMFWYCTSEFS